MDVSASVRHTKNGLTGRKNLMNAIYSPIDGCGSQDVLTGGRFEESCQLTRGLAAVPQRWPGLTAKTRY
jgi:hypothetical protein